MICGALQTLNEDAFEDVANNEHPSPTGEPTFLNLQQCLAPISEELTSPSHTRIEGFFESSTPPSNNVLTYDENSQTSTVIFIPNNVNHFQDTQL
jgi:ankyrin repeat-rich membrane spanning protein